MAFVKLDCGILQSSLWPNKAARDIFITSLLLAFPKSFKEPVEELDVRTMKPTGWAAPAGWYGMVEAAAQGLSTTAGVTLDDTKKALGDLAKPDPDSRSMDHDGRRMIRINGGYIVLNFIDYRDKDHTVTQRVRKFRSKQKQTNVTHVTPVSSVTSVTETQAEAEAEAEAEADKGGGKSAPPPEKCSEHLYDGQIPTLAEVLAIAQMKCVPEKSARSFFNHHEDGNLWVNQFGKLINWRSKLVTWATNDRQFGKSGGNKAFPETKLKAIQNEIDSHPANKESAHYKSTNTDEQKKDLRELRKKLQQTNSEIARG